MLVSLIGPSGAGKSQLVRQTATELGADLASRIPTDYFLVPRACDESLERYHARPLAYDWSLLRSRIAVPIGTIVVTPDVDWAAFTRRSDWGGESFRVNPIMICDAMEPCPGADLVVRIDVVDAIRLARLRRRDTEWGSRLADRLHHVEMTLAAHADTPVSLVLDGTRPLAENARLLARTIREWRRGESIR